MIVTVFTTVTDRRSVAFLKEILLVDKRHFEIKQAKYLMDVDEEQVLKNSQELRSNVK